MVGRRSAHVAAGHKREALERWRGESTRDEANPHRTPSRAARGGGRGPVTVGYYSGAEGGTRTPTPLRALDPESSASANSATSAPSSE